MDNSDEEDNYFVDVVPPVHRAYLTVHQMQNHQPQKPTPLQAQQRKSTNALQEDYTRLTTFQKVFDNKLKAKTRSSESQATSSEFSQILRSLPSDWY